MLALHPDRVGGGSHHRAVPGGQCLAARLGFGRSLHNFIGGLAVGSTFVLDIRLGIVTWLVAAAHEIPRELGDNHVHRVMLCYGAVWIG